MGSVQQAHPAGRDQELHRWASLREVAFRENTQESGNQKDRQQKKSAKRDSPSGGLSGTDVKAFWADGTFSKTEAKGWENMWVKLRLPKILDSQTNALKTRTAPSGKKVLDWAEFKGCFCRVWECH